MVGHISVPAFQNDAVDGIYPPSTLSHDVMTKLLKEEMGFGGVGESGMGSYHGKAGFNAFSHEKSIHKKVTWYDFPVRYSPNNKVFKFLSHLYLR